MQGCSVCRAAGAAGTAMHGCSAGLGDHCASARDCTAPTVNSYRKNSNSTPRQQPAQHISTDNLPDTCFSLQL